MEQKCVDAIEFRHWFWNLTDEEREVWTSDRTPGPGYVVEVYHQPDHDPRIVQARRQWMSMSAEELAEYAERAKAAPIVWRSDEITEPQPTAEMAQSTP